MHNTQKSCWVDAGLGPLTTHFGSARALIAIPGRSILTFVLLALLGSCSVNTPDAASVLQVSERIDLQPFGSDSELEIASWNIENFPMTLSTVVDVREIIEDLDVDIFALQEITSEAEFQNLLEALPEYDGRVGALATDGYALWPALIFKRSMVSVRSESYLFRNDPYLFPRAPYVLDLEISHNGTSLDLTMIILHLKAQGGSEDVERRRGAILKLEEYVANQLALPGGEQQFVVIGDWNDLLDDPNDNNVFLPFSDKADQYRFLTGPYAGSSTEYSYIGGNFRSLIDHVMVTTAIDTAFSNHTDIIKVDEVFPSYLLEVSDHRPVISRFAVF